MSATTDTEFVFETNKLPFWTIPFLGMLSLATSCVDAIFFQKSQPQDLNAGFQGTDAFVFHNSQAQHLNSHLQGIDDLDYESPDRGWSMCDNPVTVLSNPGHPMAAFYREYFNMEPIPVKASTPHD